MIASAEEIAFVGLSYSSDTQPGISRRRSGKGFSYRDASGKLITNPKVLQRIRSLAIPPAYEKVWICADENGHLQAAGIDARGRKQYRYHPRFREFEDENKFHRMREFGLQLPSIREQVDRDLGAPGVPKRKVLAAVVYLLEHSLIRVGNKGYARDNKSFGLTTLRNRHVTVSGQAIKFRFLGKSNISHEIEIHDARLARVIKKIQHLPGQNLFQYSGEDGEVMSISSQDVNAYLQELACKEITSKDFRTWHGSVLALSELIGVEVPASEREQRKVIATTAKAVSNFLGNTPAVCRKCYIHPAVFEAYLESKLLALRSDVDFEQVFLRLLKG